MSLISYQIVGAILILMTSLVAVIYPIKVRAHPSHNTILELADACASGIFLGAALFHMLPDAINEFQNTLRDIHYPLAESFCAGGFLFLLFLERLAESSPFAKSSAQSVPYILTFILIIHAFIEGAALGVNTTLATAAVIFLAIIAHKSSESFALAVILNKSRFTLSKMIWLISLFAFMTPIGIFFGVTLAHSLQWRSGQLMIAGFNAFAAGTFLYMSTLHHINHHERKHEGEGLLEFLALLIGFIVMAGLAWWA